jgi:DNA-binding response OmpR family regulator
METASAPCGAAMTLPMPSVPRSTEAPSYRAVPSPSSRGPTQQRRSSPMVLVVEDDALTRRVLQELLESEGYAVQAVADGAAALAYLEYRPVDLMLLDRGLPHVDGLEVSRRVRARRQGESLRIIMLTGLDDPEHILDGFDAGADDYVTKPYGARELLARVKANLRRGDLTPTDRFASLVVDERLQIDFDEQQVVVDGQRIGLGRTESALLRVLVENTGQVVPFTTILTQVWGPAYTDAPHYVHLYVTYLRRKIERDPRAPRYILSQRRVGYRFASIRDPRQTLASPIDAGAIPLE